MPDESTEVRIKFVADTASAETESKVKDTLEHVEHGAEGARHETEGLGAEIFKGNLYFELMHKGVELVSEGIHEAYEFAEQLTEQAVEAAAAADQQVRAMTGLLTMIDQGKHSYSDMRRYSEDVREELEKTGLQAGVSAKDMSEAFDQVVNRGEMSSEKAKELTEAMATVGKVSRGGMEGLSQGFMLLEMGVVRARNPIVQLIASTHTLQGNAKQVAAQLQKMSPEKQMEMGAKAIEKQAENMKKAGGAQTPSLAMLKTSFEGVREAFFESMGKPMLDALLPPLTKVKNFLVEHIDTIKQWGSQIGDAFAHVIETISGIFGGVYDAIHENWDDIVFVGKEITSSFRETFGYIYDNKDAFAHTFKDIITDFIHGFRWVIEKLEALEAGIKSLLKYIPGVGDMVRKSEAGDAEGEMRKKAQFTGGGADKDFKESVEHFRQLALAAGQTAPEVDELTKKIQAQHDIANEAAKKFDFEASMGQKSEAMMDYINNAIKLHREGAMQHAIAVMEGSQMARNAFMAGAGQVEGGFDAFIHMLEEKAPELAAKLKDMANVVKKEGGVKGVGGPSVNFNGGQTFNIKQDFRDQDPDRIALVFRRDILRAAESRRQSRVATPFGV
jgi:hypothetical protein